MAKKESSISWTNFTWNPWMGCHKVSAGCKFCYLYRNFENQNQDAKNVFINTSQLFKPLSIKKSQRIFTCSMSDFFLQEADKVRPKVWEIIKNSQHHTFQILTKRPERIKECLPKDWCQKNYSNVWLGVSIESMNELHRLHTLKDVPCELRWVSFEPLLGEIFLSKDEIDIIDWAVIGGESGTNENYRKSELSWFLSLMYQLRDSQTPIFFKQFGTWYHHNHFYLRDWKGEKYCPNFNEFFRIRQYPKIKDNG